MLNSRDKNHCGRTSSTANRLSPNQSLSQPVPNPFRYRYSAEEALVSDELANLGSLLASLESFSER